ncbi:MAG: recombinase family protein [Actinomycetota bacterium]|nr:recombinase family protein [Actinomycetota bacterium]
MTARPKQSSPAVKAGVYTRISSDPSGERAGVDRQRADCEAHCKARGWEVVEVFCDNDASAYGRKPRRAYERMLAAVESGNIDAIVTWHNDRLHRSPKELEAFIDLVERSGVRLAVVTGGDYDLTTPDGRLSARIVGAVARKESEDRSRRVRRKHLELAELGRPAGQLGWGVRSEDERELVREAARRVLEGDGLMTIARDWNTQGIPGASGGPWGAPTLRRVLLSSRIAGLREHGVDPSGKTLGDLSTAVWAAALDRQMWDQVRAVLLNPERNTNVRKATRYLLTGLIYCGGCGGALFSRPRNNTRRYLCAGRRPGHQLGIIADPVDELVKEFVLRLLTTPSVREALLAQAGAGDDGAMGRTLADLGAAQRRLQALDDDFYVRGVLAEGRYRSIRVKLEREIDRLHAMVDAGTKQRIVLHPDPRAFWAAADFQQRRELVRLMVERVEVMPGRSALRRFDASRVRIHVSTLQPRKLLDQRS